MGALASPVSVEECLGTTYRPDCDYIDGVLAERHVGQFEHSSLQALILFQLTLRAKEWGVLVLPELRLKVGEGKYRVPDLVVLPAHEPHPPVIERPPLLCIEIVSPEDRLANLSARASD